MTTMNLPNARALGGGPRRRRLAFADGNVAQQLLEPRSREKESNRHGGTSGVANTDARIARDVDGCAFFEGRLLLAEDGDARAAVHEDDFVGVQMPVRWDDDSGRDILVAHHELPGSTIQPIHLDDERKVST